MADTNEDSIRVLWLTPDKPETISVGRRRIAEHLRDEGLRVTLRGTTPRTALSSFRERAEYDVVVGTTRAGAFAGAGLKLAGVPLVVDHVDPIRQFAETHGTALSFGVGLAENVAFRLADHTLYVYDEERPRVERYARAATETDLGVAFEAFADPDRGIVADARAHLAESGVGPETPLAIYVGGLEPIYHVEALLGAMDRLDDWTLAVLGTGSLEGLVERAAAERENVVFLGSVPHERVPGYLHAAEAGVALVDDPHTLKILEYAAAGLPAVGLHGRVEDRFGEFVECCDPNPESVARAVGRAGERDVEAFRDHVGEFDYARIAEGYAQVIRRVVGAGKR
ncbi:glycosyltransferase [Halococcus hamelinensis]|uniref:Group 1 glycosyl transferase n=1 Tax=Halococcus hamelinensis 100A6 TaxID=1132509 RepID=M0LWL4_9EURY|nr:glycosyltransferase [Halococcus hamelinensis]EMA37967.1 group 1 glycosyl transferase [Halococcus hamelinensis 100A6]